MVSDLGTWVQLATIGTLVTNASGKAAAAGLIAAATFAPQGIGAPLGGVLADRVDRRRLFLATLGIQTVVTMLLTLLVASGERSPNRLAVLILFQAGAGSMGSPALQSILPELVPPDEMLAASSLGLLGWNIGRVVGPVIAALLAVFGPTWAIAANAVSFVALWLGIASLRRPFPPAAQNRGTVIADLSDGARALWTARGCLFAVGAAVSLHLLIIPFMGFAPVFARELRGGGASDESVQRLTSLLLSTQGLGAVVGGLMVTSLAATWGRSRTMHRMLIVTCAMLCLYVLAPGAAFAVACVLVLGGSIATVQSLMIATNQHHAPAANRGRILSWWQGMVGLGYGAGLWIHGRLGDVIGLKTSLIGAAAIVTFGGGVFSRVRPSWRALVDLSGASSRSH
jgi:MFS family permease